MNIDEIRALGNECYSAFNQSPPAHSARAWSLWADMCQYVPLEAAPWIRDQIIELESIPRNFGKAVRDHFWRWRAETGKGVRISACPDCDVATPGYFLAWGRDGHGMPVRFVVRCACNVAPGSTHLMTLSRSRAVCEGYEVLTSGESVVAFEMRLANRAVPARIEGKGAYLNAARNQDFTARREHVEALAEAESW